MKEFSQKYPTSEWYEEGMDLRDYFAAQVLQCIVIDDTNIHSSADFCYKVANAMMEARKND